MATVWLDPGGSATGGTQFWTTVAGAISAQTSDTHGQAYAYELSTSSPAANTFGQRGGTQAAAGRRNSLYYKLPVLPSTDTDVRALNIRPTTGAALLGVIVDSAGKLRLYTNNVVTQLGATSSTVLTANTWYRITLSYAITSTTNWSAKVYINGVLEMTRTNADGTLSSALPTLIESSIISTAGTNFLSRVADIYVDDGTDQADPAAGIGNGELRVTAKLPTTTTTNNFDSTLGTGAVNERPVNTANGKFHAGTTDVDQDYQIQTAAAGDVDISTATIVDSMGWIWANLSSLTGTPLSKIIVNGARVATAWDSTSASTTVGQLFTTIVGSSSYPLNANGKNIGTSSSVIAADTYLFDCGVVVAYIPAAAAAGTPFVGMLEPMQAEAALLNY